MSNPTGLTLRYFIQKRKIFENFFFIKRMVQKRKHPKCFSEIFMKKFFKYCDDSYFSKKKYGKKSICADPHNSGPDNRK